MTVPRHERVPHDLGLLLDPVAGKRPAGFDAVVVAAERVPHRHQKPPPAALRLQYAADSGRWQVRKCRGGPAPALGFAQARH